MLEEKEQKRQTGNPKARPLLARVFWSAIYAVGFSYFVLKAVILLLVETHLIIFVPWLTDLDAMATYFLSDPIVQVRHSNGALPHRIGILFAGNSYTAVWDMPGLLMKIAASDVKNKNELDIGTITRNGARLKALWPTDARKKILAARRWDYIVMQEQSVWATSAEGIENAEKGVGEWSAAARALSARPVLYQTWARKPGSGDYGLLLDEQDAAEMQRDIDNHTYELAKEFHTTIVPVGDFWMIAARQTPPLPIYFSDGSHPSPAGAYLTALVFYRYLLGGSPRNVTYVPAEVTPDLAAKLKEIAASN